MEFPRWWVEVLFVADMAEFGAATVDVKSMMLGVTVVW